MPPHPPWRIPQYHFTPQTFSWSHGSPKTTHYLHGGHGNHQDTQTRFHSWPRWVLGGILQKKFPIPYLVRFFNSLQLGSPLDKSLNLAYISVIPKPGKDPTVTGNYHTISLINNDFKLLTKILSNRLSSFIAQYVHKDQAGFIPGRQGPDQVRRAIDVVSLLGSHWDGGPPQEGFLLSIDLQKAFDMVTWPYIFKVLERWGLGPNFLSILHSLYSNLSAQVRM